MTAHSNHLYEYEEHGGTKVSARELECGRACRDQATLIMEDEHAKPLIVLMHGDCKVSTKELARQVAKKVETCKPEVANRHRLPGGRHQPLRHQEGHAHLHGVEHPGPAPDLSQRRPSRLPGGGPSPRRSQGAAARRWSRPPSRISRLSCQCAVYRPIVEASLADLVPMAFASYRSLGTFLSKAQKPAAAGSVLAARASLSSTWGTHFDGIFRHLTKFQHNVLSPFAKDMAIEHGTTMGGDAEHRPGGGLQ